MRILRTGFILHFKSRWENINMSHLDIPACSRKHQQQCQFEWNREKAGSSHSPNLLFKVLTHYQLHPFKSCVVGCWPVPHHACSALDHLVLLETTHTETWALGFKGDSKSKSFSIGEHSILFSNTETGDGGGGHPQGAVDTPSAGSSLHLRQCWLATELMCRHSLWTMSWRQAEIASSLLSSWSPLLTISGQKPANSSKSRTRS